jgi:CBS-domain-containing membrane protein
MGSAFGMLLIALGVIAFITGHFISGMWWFLIGMFLRAAASMSYQQLLVRRALEGEPVRRFMNTVTTTVPPGTSVAELVEDYVYKHHYKMFPVVHNGDMLGCVSTRRVKEIPRDEWNRRRVDEIAEPCSPENTISPETDALKALATMHRTGASRLMVVEGGHLAGIVSLKDLMNFIAMKIDLEEGEPW